MKVAILSLYSGHVERGVEVWAESLKQSLKDRCEVQVFGNTKVPINWNKPDLRGKPTRSFFVDYWSILTARFTFSVLPELTKYNPHIVIPTNGGWQVLIIRLYTWLYGKKMVVVGHAGIGGDEFWNLWCFPDVFVALSTFASKWARRKNPFIRVSTIPNGIWPSEFSPKGKKASLSLHHPIYLYVGALEPGKRPSLAIEAVARLKKGSLLILGKGDSHMEAEIDHLGNEILGSRYERRSVPHSKIAEFYRVADVFTLPTWSQEAFGMVYLEAMSCGLPIVTTDDPVKREIIGDAGIFIDPTNLSDYSEALLKATHLIQPERSQKQAQLFSWLIVSKKYLALFNKLI